MLPSPPCPDDSSFTAQCLISKVVLSVTRSPSNRHLLVFIVTLLVMDHKCGVAVKCVLGYRTPRWWRVFIVLRTCHRVEAEAGAEQSKSALRVIEELLQLGCLHQKHFVNREFWPFSFLLDWSPFYRFSHQEFKRSWIIYWIHTLTENSYLHDL